MHGVDQLVSPMDIDHFWWSKRTCQWDYCCRPCPSHDGLGVCSCLLVLSYGGGSHSLCILLAWVGRGWSWVSYGLSGWSSLGFLGSRLQRSSFFALSVWFPFWLRGHRRMAAGTGKYQGSIFWRTARESGRSLSYWYPNWLRSPVWRISCSCRISWPHPASSSWVTSWPHYGRLASSLARKRTSRRFPSHSWTATAS